MMPKLLLGFSLILLFATSCRHNVTSCNKNFVDSSYRYTEDEFNKLCARFENKKVDRDKLECKFKGVYSTEARDGFVTYAFVLFMYPETIDTCWGVINYESKTKVVKNCGMFCQ